MAVAAPKRRSSAAPAPAPSRTAPPKRKKAAPGPSPIRRTKGASTARSAAAAPATAPARRAPSRTTPSRRAPQRARPKTKRSGGQPSLAVAVGRTAGAVRQLPDTGLIVRMTRGRAWIGVLGILLVGIVGLNVVTLSFAASSGKIDEQISTLEAENSSLSGRVATLYGTDRIRNEAAGQGLRTSTEIGPQVIQFDKQDIAIAAQRLSGAE
jgi:hypothetical protein